MDIRLVVNNQKSFEVDNVPILWNVKHKDISDSTLYQNNSYKFRVRNDESAKNYFNLWNQTYHTNIPQLFDKYDGSIIINNISILEGYFIIDGYNDNFIEITFFQGIGKIFDESPEIGDLNYLYDYYWGPTNSGEQRPPFTFNVRDFLGFQHPSHGYYFPRFTQKYFDYSTNNDIVDLDGLIFGLTYQGKYDNFNGEKIQMANGSIAVTEWNRGSWGEVPANVSEHEMTNWLGTNSSSTQWEGLYIVNRQIPFIRLKALYNLCLKYIADLGYKINLDKFFFRDENPYWNLTYLAVKNNTSFDGAGDQFCANVLPFSSPSLPQYPVIPNYIYQFNGDFEPSKELVTGTNIKIDGYVDAEVQVTFTAAQINAIYNNYYGKNNEAWVYVDAGNLRFDSITVEGPGSPGYINQVLWKNTILEVEKDQYGNEIRKLDGSIHMNRRNAFKFIINQNATSYVATWKKRFSWVEMNEILGQLKKDGFNYDKIESFLLDFISHPVAPATYLKFNIMHNYNYENTMVGFSNWNMYFYSPWALETQFVNPVDIRVRVTTGNICVGSSAVGDYSFNMKKLFPNNIKCIDFILSYGKLFDLFYTIDENKKEFNIEYRDNFYKNEIIDIDDRVVDTDTNKIVSLPNKVLFQLKPNNTIYEKAYSDKYNKEYGALTVLTNDNRNDTVLDYFKSLNFTNSVPGSLSSKYFYLRSAFPYKDNKELAVFEDKNGKQSGDIFSLYFLNGSSYYPTGSMGFYTLNSSTMDDNCWYWDPGAVGKYQQITTYHNFTKTFLHTDGETYSLYYGIPVEVYNTSDQLLNGATGATIYQKFFQKFVEDKYDYNSKIIQRKVKLHRNELKDALRKFYFYDHGLWSIQEIKAYDIRNESDICDVTMIKVNNINAYLHSYYRVLYTLSFDPNGKPLNGSTAIRFHEVLEGTNFNITYVPTVSVGENFDGWKSSLDGVLYPGGSTVFNVQSNISFVAQYSSVQTFTITFDPMGQNLNGGTTPIIYTVNKGSNFAIPNLVPSAPYNQNFSGWKVTSAGTESGNTFQSNATIYNVQNNMMLQAQYTTKPSLGEVTVNFDFHRDNNELGGYITGVSMLDSAGSTVGSVNGTGLSPESPGDTNLNATRTSKTFYNEPIVAIRVSVNNAFGKSNTYVSGGGKTWNPNHFFWGGNGGTEFDATMTPNQLSGDFSFTVRMEVAYPDPQP